MSDVGLKEEFKGFADRLFSRLPWFAEHAVARARGDATAPENVLVQIASPTGDAGRSVTIWLEDGEPSVEFGPWHTHATAWGAESPGDQTDAIINLIEAIFADEFVLMEDVGGQYDGHTGVLDRRNRDDLTDELTSKWSPGRVRLKSWTGRVDKEIALEDVDHGETA